MTRRSPLSAALTAVAVVLATLVVFLAPARALTNCSVSAGDQAVDSEEQQLLELINEYRVANGRAPLAMDPAVTRAAAWFARDMATKDYIAYDHVDSLGRNVPTRLTQCDVAFTAYAENIAWGFATAEDVFEAWRDSPTHNTNMLRPEVTRAGIGRAFDAASAADWYWVLDLTAPATGGTTTTAAPTTTTVAPTTTSIVLPTTSSSIVLPTTTSVVLPTTSSSVVLPTTSSSIVLPTTTSIVLPTIPSTTTTSTPLPTTTTSIASTTTTVTLPPSGGTCAALLASRAQTNAQITAMEQALARSLSGAELQARIAQLEQIRAAYNAHMNQTLAQAGCLAG